MTFPRNRRSRRSPPSALPLEEHDPIIITEDAGVEADAEGEVGGGEVLAASQHGLMIHTFRQAPLTRQTWAQEVAAVARAAAAEGDYGPAAKLYETFGKHLGVLSDVQVHMHGIGSAAEVAGAVRLSQLSDAELLAMAEAREAKHAEVVGG